MTRTTTKQLNLLPPETMAQAAECLKVMGHPARLRIAEILMQAKMTVGEIAELCELQPNQACEHLRLLKGHGLLECRRQGRSVYYSIAHPRLTGLINCIRRSCDVQEK